MRLPSTTSEKNTYAKYWSSNSSTFEKQGCYEWMSGLLDSYKPKRILDIGCGTGEGVLSLLNRFEPDRIISIDENAACISSAAEKIKSLGWELDSQLRIGYQDVGNGLHELCFDPSPIIAEKRVSLIHADILFKDDDLIDLFTKEGPFDAVTVWLTGTYKARNSCRSLSNLNIKDTNDYRLRVQNRVYEIASEVLKSGGILQVVDRGEDPNEGFLREDLLAAHRDQASVTDLNVFDIQSRSYSEPTDKGMGMVVSPGSSGRMPRQFSLAMISILSRKP